MDRTALALCVDILGPLALRVQGRAVDVPGARRRALLAVLAVEGERGIAADLLVDALWPDDPPENTTQALYNHISRLRGHLGALGDRLERTPRGYRLHLEPFELDADAARRLAGSDPEAALAQWRGPALAEFRALPALEAAAVPLEELRLQLVDDRLEVRLGRGDRDVVVHAAAAAAAAPLRERTTLLHVRALAADGRTAEAMAAAQAFRRRLAEEAGLDPGAELGELEQRVAAGYAARAAVLRRVPKPDGPMVGRQHDREQVLRLLGVNAVVTVTGPSGVGKTRLALDIAADFGEGTEVVVVALGAVDRADRVCRAVASCLRLRTAADATPAGVAVALADRELLLVLDNCEHVADACRALVVALRQGAPRVRVLATSRVTLQVPGEYVVRLQPLPVPRDVSDLDALRRQPAVRAFTEHARRRRPEFELTADQAADLVEVLRRLDGLPLGIELAARQVAVMPMRAVRERLGRALDLAIGRHGPDDERRRTLRASIDSSYRLLSADEQRLLRAIAPFAGGVDVATVEMLAEHLGGDPIDLLHRLVDSSLLVADAESGRYWVLFTVRDFLVDALARLDESGQAHHRFVERCVATAEEIGLRMFGTDEGATDRRLRAELDNFRSARDLADTDDRVAITVALNSVVTWRDVREIWDWATELAEDPSLADHPGRVAILACAADAARLVGDFDTAERRAREVMASADSPEHAGPLARAWSVRAAVAHFRGDFATARDAWLTAAEGPTAESSAFLGSAALAASYGGDLAAARRLLERARSIATCGSHRAFASYVEGEIRVTAEPADAIPYYVEAIAQASQVGCNFVEGVARVSLASARMRFGDVAGAAEGFGYLIRFWRRTGQTTQLWTTARNAAELLASVGRIETAARLLVCADAAPGAAAVSNEIARFSGRFYTPVESLAGLVSLDELRAETRRLGSAVVLDQALVDLRNLVADESRVTS